MYHEKANIFKAHCAYLVGVLYFCHRFAGDNGNGSLENHPEKRCGGTFYERKENRFCAACRTARKKQAQRHWCRVNGMSRK